MPRPLKLESYNLAAIERAVIERVLKATRGSLADAAKALGVTRWTLRRKLKKHGIAI